MPRVFPSRLNCQWATVASSPPSAAARRIQNTLAPSRFCAAPWSNTKQDSGDTDRTSNKSSISRKMSTSLGSVLAVTNDPKTMKRARCPVLRASRWIRSSRRVMTARRGVAPKCRTTSSKVARWTPIGKSPASLNSGHSFIAVFHSSLAGGGAESRAPLSQAAGRVRARCRRGRGSGR
jgi:hypothetical protein